MAVGDKYPVLMASQLGMPNGPAGLNDDALLPILQGGVEAGNPQLALANLGAGVRPNLLFNPSFSINQRGQTEYSAIGYSADGWCIPNNTAKITVHQNAGVILEAQAVTSSGQVDTCWQHIPEAVVKKLSGKTCTISCLFDPTTLVGAGWAFVVRFGAGAGNSYVGVASTGYASAASNLLSATFKVPTNADTIRAIFADAAEFVQIGDKINPTDVKFEEGPNQTLAYEVSPGQWAKIPQAESDDATQWERCLQYLLNLDYGSTVSTRNYPGTWVQTASNAGQYVIPLPATMRATPGTVTAEGQFYIWGHGNTGAASIPVKLTYAPSASSPNSITLQVAVPGDVLPDPTISYVLSRRDQASRILVSCEV